jgi:hypothetical protein
MRGPVSSESGPFDDALNLNRPGAFTEGFKRFIAAKNSGESIFQHNTGSSSQDTEPEIPPQAEMVRRMFKGTVVRNEG